MFAHWRIRTALVALCAVATVLVPQALARSSARPAAPRGAARYVSGRVNVAGDTVVVVGYNGKTASSHSQTFRIAAPDSRVTVQLIDAGGHYAGPVVFGGSATRVITGVRVPVALGTVDVVASQGYARLARRLASRSLDRARWAYATHGVPIGNGRNLGLVSSRGKGGGAGAGGDLARVGIPNEFDIAVPGTHVLRALAPASIAKSAPTGTAPRRAARIVRASQTGPTPPNPPPAPNGPTSPVGPTSPAGTTGPAGPVAPGNGPAPAGPSVISPWMSRMFLPMDQTVNEDAAGVSTAEVDSTLQDTLNLKLLNVPTDAGLLELDCHGLSFCSTGGTGQAVLEGLPLNGALFNTVPFPAGSLDSATGLGEIVGPAVPSGLLGGDANGGHEFSLDPHATTTQIGSGDVITELITANGTVSQIPTTIDFVFNTVPAIASYADSAGDSGAIAYPDVSALGTNANPIQVAAGPNGDVVMTFTLYRPQRQGVAGAGEPAFMDIGHLGYELDFASAPPPGSTLVGSPTSPQCSAASYSNPSSTLALSTGGGSGQPAPAGTLAPPLGAGEMIDSAADQPANPGATISFTVDLAQCMAAKGITSFPIGQPMQFDVSANSQSSSDHANQTFVVERTR